MNLVLLQYVIDYILEYVGINFLILVNKKLTCSITTMFDSNLLLVGPTIETVESPQYWVDCVIDDKIM